jgi:hypothetical protein
MQRIDVSPQKSLQTMSCNFVFEVMPRPMDEIEYKRDRMKFYALTAVTTKVLKCLVYVMPCSLTDM